MDSSDISDTGSEDSEESDCLLLSTSGSFNDQDEHLNFT